MPVIQNRPEESRKIPAELRPPHAPFPGPGHAPAVHGWRSRARSGLQGIPVHDALAVAAVSHPQLLGWESGQATVECAGSVTDGALVADLLTPERSQHTRVARTVNAEGFTMLLNERLSSYTH